MADPRKGLIKNDGTIRATNLSLGSGAGSLQPPDSSHPFESLSTAETNADIALPSVPPTTHNMIRCVERSVMPNMVSLARNSTVRLRDTMVKRSSHVITTAADL